MCKKSRRATHTRQQLAIIYSVGVSTIYRYFPATLW
ncbi:helix-turn-helix domain-containing protein [Morganella morganii]|nr:helix-turn-helix domain-containing protein [Morganella morganii]